MRRNKNLKKKRTHIVLFSLNERHQSKHFSENAFLYLLCYIISIAPIISAMNTIDMVVLVGLMAFISFYGLYKSLKGNKQSSSANEVLHGTK